MPLRISAFHVTYWCWTSHHFPFFVPLSKWVEWRKKMCVDALLLLLLLLMCVIAFRYVYVIVSVSCARLLYFFVCFVSLFPTSTSNQTKININWLYRFCFPLGGFFYSIVRHSYTSTTTKNTLFWHFEWKMCVCVCIILLLLFATFPNASQAQLTQFLFFSSLSRSEVLLRCLWDSFFLYIYVSLLSANCISWLRIWVMQLNAKLSKCCWLCSVYV